MAPVDVRKGMPPVELSREEFEKRYRSRFADPAFEPLQRELDAITAAAWDAYSSSRKFAAHAQGGTGLCRSGLRHFSELARGARGHSRRTAPA